MPEPIKTNKLENVDPTFSSSVGDFGRLFLSVYISAIVWCKKSFVLRIVPWGLQKNFFKWRVILAIVNAIYAVAQEACEKFRNSTEFEPVTSRCRCDSLTSHWCWQLRSIMCSYVPVKEMNVIDVQWNPVNTVTNGPKKNWPYLQVTVLTRVF